MIDSMHIVLNIRKGGTQAEIRLVSGDSDSRTVEISLVADGRPVDITELDALIHVLGESGKGNDECLKDEENNRFVYTFPRGCFPEAGEYKCELKVLSTSLEGAQAVLYTPKFCVVADRALFEAESDENVPESTFTDLENLFSSTVAARKAANDAATEAQEAAEEAQNQAKSAFSAASSAMGAANIASTVAQSIERKAENGDFNGKDGMDARHEWNGTVLTITSANGTSSSDLKGEKGETGGKGERGEDGGYYSPRIVQSEEEVFYFVFDGSDQNMPTIPSKRVVLPVGPQGPQGPQGEPGKDAVGEVFELLDTIELAENRTLSENIIPCTRLFLKLKTTTDSLDSLNINAAMGGTALGRGTFSAISAAGTYYGILDVWQEAGWWRARNLRWTTKNSVSVPNDGNDWGNFLTKSVAAYPAINRITSSVALPAGTTIEVWGVPLTDEYAVSTLEELEE